MNKQTNNRFYFYFTWFTNQVGLGLRKILKK
jgi:hypothetical protein